MSNSNTSATGGYLFETGTQPVYDNDLKRFLHDVIAGVTCIDNELVRPGWARNPQVIPSIDTDWVSFSITEQRPDFDPYQSLDENEKFNLITNEEFDVLCSFYGENSQQLSGILREGLYLSQNREQLFLAKMGLVGFSNTIHIPELINDRYFERYDITMTLRREIQREYPILSFVGVDGVVKANVEEKVFTESFSVVE